MANVKNAGLYKTDGLPSALLSDPHVSSGHVKGAVMLLGSLYWEGSQDDPKGETMGKTREEWRKKHLEMAGCRDLTDIPIRYGRLSAKRNRQFTIVLGGKPHGVAKIANLKNSLPVNEGKLAKKAVKMLKQEVEALAQAEGIWSKKNKQHCTTWGLVSIAINPESEFKDQIRELWKKHFPPGAPFKLSEYDADILDKDGILQISLNNHVWKGLDFCLATPTKPEPRVPSAKEIAEAVKLGSYFHRTSKSGIKTPDDDEIRKHLGEQVFTVENP